MFLFLAPVAGDRSEGGVRKNGERAASSGDGAGEFSEALKRVPEAGFCCKDVKDAIFLKWETVLTTESTVSTSIRRCKMGMISEQFRNC